MFLSIFNRFLTNVPFMGKPGNCFLLAKCLKNTLGRVTFAMKNQLPGFCKSGKLVENGLIKYFDN